MEIEKLNRIFADSECISNQMMIDYLDGKLSDKEKNMVENHLNTCELCKDEFDGLSAMIDKNKLPQIVFELNQQITKKTRPKRKVMFFSQVISMAAIILLLVGFAWFFFYIIHLSPESLKRREMAQALEKAKQDELAQREYAQKIIQENTVTKTDSISIETPGIERIKQNNDISIGRSEQNLPITEKLVEEKKDEIKAGTNGIVETDVVRESIVSIDVAEDKKVNKDEKITDDFVSNNVAVSEMEDRGENEKLLSRSKKEKAKSISPAVLYQQGIQAFEKKEYSKAIEFLQQSAELDSNKVKQYFYMGQSYQNIGKLSKAIDCYDKVIAIPNNEYLEKALWNKSQIQVKQGQTKEAVKTLEKTKNLKGVYMIPAQTQIDSLRNK